MTEAIVTSALAPLMKDPSPRAELVSQMLTGETGTIMEDRQPWLRIRRAFDWYDGWVHRGYLRLVSQPEADSWRQRAGFLAEAAELEDIEGRRLHLPLLARLAPLNDEWELASGIHGRVVGGSVHPAEALCQHRLSVGWHYALGRRLFGADSNRLRGSGPGPPPRLARSGQSRNPGGDRRG
jgi:hypothetical protein